MRRSSMICVVKMGERSFRSDLSEGLDITIPFIPGAQGPNCFYAPLLEASPLKVGDFIGAISAGSPVNFYNVRINPHGNGTHTECVGHIKDGSYYIKDSCPTTPLISKLISVYPTRQDNGDLVIEASSLKVYDWSGVQCAIVRTLPNDTTKLTRSYSGTNPTFFDPEAIQYINDCGIEHLVVDIPSIDREEDGGHLLSHHTFWVSEDTIDTKKTITELVFVDSNIKDGLFLCTINAIPLQLDAAPSRLVLYPLIEDKKNE